MSHKFVIGQSVLFSGRFPRTGATGAYKVIRVVPMERDDQVRYRIKSETENFERVVEEYQLTAVE